MKVWWCEEHSCGGNNIYCWYSDIMLWGDPCRMVEMQLVSADARVVSGAQDAIEYLETLGLVHGPLPVQYFMDYFVVVIPEDYPKGPKDLDGVPFKSGDLVDLIRFRSEPLDAVSVSDPTKTAT